MRSLQQSSTPPRAIALAILLMALAVPTSLPAEGPGGADPGARAAQGTAAPPASGLIERSEVRLMLLEVEAIDKEGQPLRGLTLADFTVHLGGRRAVIESVDDLCDCAGRAPDGSGGPAIRASAHGGAEAPSPSGSAPDPAAPTADAGSDRFVLYLDFGQMALDGRHEAIEAARHWITRIRQPGEQAMMVAYVTDRGVGVLQPFTDSPAELLKALDQAERNLGMVDHFAVQLERRLEDCTLDPGTCWSSSRQEYDHGRRSLTALQKFLAHLAIEPGRKTVLYFHENGLMSPGRIYGQRELDQVNLVDRVGAEATSSRAVIYPVKVGAPPGAHVAVD
jgi:VWFA-related protein